MKMRNYQVKNMLFVMQDTLHINLASEFDVDFFVTNDQNCDFYGFMGY